MIIDFTDINAINALYISITIGMTIKFLWGLNVKYSFIGSFSETANTKIIHPLYLYKRKSGMNRNYILIRIVKYIRRKTYSKDDAEEHVSCCFI